MDNSLFSDDDSLPTFQEGDIITCFEEKSQIIEHFEKDVDISYSHRLLSFLKNDQGKNSARNSFLENENITTQRESRFENKEQFNQSFIPPEDNDLQCQQQQQMQQKSQLKRSLEKKSLAIPFTLQQQQQIQNSQRNFDKFDRPPLSQRMDTRSNQMNSTIQQNKELKKSQQSQQSLTDRGAKDCFNPFGNDNQSVKTERSSLSLRNSREGKLSTESIKNFYLDLQKQMQTQKLNEKDNSDKENINPNICQQNPMKQIEIEDIQIHKSQQSLNQQKQFNSSLNKVDKKANVIESKDLQANNSLGHKNIKVNKSKQNGYLFVDDEESNISQQSQQIKVKENSNESQEAQFNKQLQNEQEDYPYESNKTTEQNEILHIVSKIRSIKSQIDDVNKIVNLKKKELDNFVKSSRYQNTPIAFQKSKEEDLNTLKKLTASTAFLNNKYDEMNQNYQDYLKKKEKCHYNTNQSDSTQDQFNENTNSFMSKNNNNNIQLNYLSQNSTQINNSSFSQIQSNSKMNTNQYNTVSNKIKNPATANQSNQKTQIQTYASQPNSIERSSKERAIKEQLSQQRLNTIDSSRRHYLKESNNYQIDQDINESIKASRGNYQAIRCEGQSSHSKINQNLNQISSKDRLKTLNNQSDDSSFQTKVNQPLSSSLCQTQSQNPFIRAKTQEQKSQMSKDNSLLFDQPQQQQMSSQVMIQNLISKLSLNKYTDKLNKLLSNHPSNQQSNNKEHISQSQSQSKQNQEYQQMRQATPQSNKNTSSFVSPPSQSNLKLPKNSSQQQIEKILEQKPAKQQRSYSYQEKYAIQKQLVSSVQQKIQQN